jgi:hypothetical protein
VISKDLLDILACPLCKSDLRLEGEKLHCTNAACNCRYLVQDDIPNMLVDEAERPCPKCSQPRTWEPESDSLSCACGERFAYQRAGTKAK